MNRYDLIHVAELLFALGAMFAAFLAGLAVGRWRWGRDRRGEAAGSPAHLPVHRVKPDLFTPAGRDDTVDLTLRELAPGIRSGAGAE